MRGFDHTSGEFIKVDGAKIYYELSGNEDCPALLVRLKFLEQLAPP